MDFTHALFCPQTNKQAQALADDLGLACVHEAPLSGWYLSWKDGMLACYLGTQSYHVDFLGSAFQHRIQSLTKKDPLIRALGLHKKPNMHIIDATAGLGQDGLCMAHTGAKVTLLEQSPFVFALLKDGLRRAKTWLAAQESEIVAAQANSIDYLRSLKPEAYPDIIYLDPMYPERSKQALSKLPMQCLQAITEPQDEQALFEMALQRSKHRVVVKRPLRIKPNKATDLSIAGKNHRFDIYFVSDTPQEKASLTR